MFWYSHWLHLVCVWSCSDHSPLVYQWSDHILILSTHHPWVISVCPVISQGWSFWYSPLITHWVLSSMVTHVLILSTHYMGHLCLSWYPRADHGQTEMTHSDTLHSSPMGHLCLSIVTLTQGWSHSDTLHSSPMGQRCLTSLISHWSHLILCDHPWVLFVHRWWPSGLISSDTLHSSPMGHLCLSIVDDPVGWSHSDTLHSSPMGHLCLSMLVTQGWSHSDTLHSSPMGHLVSIVVSQGWSHSDTLHSSPMGLIMFWYSPSLMDPGLITFWYSPLITCDQPWVINDGQTVIWSHSDTLHSSPMGIDVWIVDDPWADHILELLITHVVISGPRW